MSFAPRPQQQLFVTDDDETQQSQQQQSQPQSGSEKAVVTFLSEKPTPGSKGTTTTTAVEDNDRNRDALNKAKLMNTAVVPASTANSSNNGSANNTPAPSPPSSWTRRNTSNGSSKSSSSAKNNIASLRILIAVALVLPAAGATVANSRFLREWRGGIVIEWLAAHPEIPIALAVLYLGFVAITPKVVPSTLTTFFVQSEVLKCVLSAWNLFFSVFSFLGFVYSLPALIQMVSGNPITGLAVKENRITGALEPAPTAMHGSLLSSLCYWNANVFQDGMAAFWLLAFDLSKIIEMMDTVFLVLKGKKVLLLHWYHHLTVMMFCWHAHVTYISNGLWFAVMNMGIHTIMYLYYFCFSCGLARLVKPFAPVITVLQIVQMIAGLVLQLCTLLFYIRLRREHGATGNGANCDTNLPSLIFGLLMYGSYFGLFILFFVNVYLRKDRSAFGGRRARDAASSLKEQQQTSGSSSSSNSIIKSKDGSTTTTATSSSSSDDSDATATATAAAAVVAAAMEGEGQW